jgi:hypothetical protein
MSLERIEIRVVEEVECFEDKWDYTSETHYTNDWVETVENVYEVDVESNDIGEIVETQEQIERKLREVVEGKLIAWEIL